MQFKDGRIHLDEEEYEALSMLSPMMKKLGRDVDLSLFRQKLEELREAGEEKFQDLMQNRWDNEEQRRRAAADETTTEMLQFLTYGIAQGVAEKFLSMLDEATARRH